MFSAVVAFRTAKSARFTLKADVLAPVIDVRRHEAAQRKPSCSHLGHWGFAVPCSEIVSVRSNGSDTDRPHGEGLGREGGARNKLQAPSQ